MRTTIRLADPVLRDAKKLAAETGRSLTAVIEDTLREAMARRKKVRRQRVRLPTFAGRGLRPGVNLDNWASLLDRMEGDDGAR
jgi:hypothetical protein